jgi:hypothetical protein
VGAVKARAREAYPHATGERFYRIVIVSTRRSLITSLCSAKISGLT